MSLTSTAVNREKIPALRWLRIIPPVLITCIISYMDRVNIAFAMPGEWTPNWASAPQWPVWRAVFSSLVTCFAGAGRQAGRLR